MYHGSFTCAMTYRVMETAGSIHSSVPWLIRPGGVYNMLRPQAHGPQQCGHVCPPCPLQASFWAKEPEPELVSTGKRVHRGGWYRKASQTNFTTGVRGSLHKNQFLTRLESLGVKNKYTREAIRNRTVQKKTSMSDMILKFFFIALTPRQNGHSNPYSQKLPTRAWKDLIYTSNHQGRHQTA